MEHQITLKGRIYLGLGIAALAVILIWVLQNFIPTSWKDAVTETVAPGGSPTTLSSDGSDVINVCVVTWGGYVGGEYFNGGFKPSEQSRYYKQYGLKVKFQIMDEFVPSRDAWKSDKCHLLWATVDAFTTEAANLQRAGYDPRFVFQADWSRGGDAIVVGPGINSMRDLRGRTIAVAYGTPSHTFLLRMLESANMQKGDVTLIDTGSAIDAAKAFQTRSADAAVVWSPDDVASVRAIPGAKVLVSSKQASHIIADGFFAKEEYIAAHREQLQHLIEGWMIGAAEINSDPAAKQKAATILADGLNLSVDDALAAINNVRLTTFGDNLAFFGLDSSYTGMTGERLFRDSGALYQKNGYANLVPSVPDWRTVIDLSLLRNISLTGPEHAAESTVRFAVPTTADVKANAFSSKALSVQFSIGSAVLTDEAKANIATNFVPTAQSFANARIRIEGNTDSTGSRAINVDLSRRRAQAVADYLGSFGFDPNRFIVAGNGPDKPACGTSDAGCLAQNRRTDFELLNN
ncbi:MAG: phosphate ABC transporter substrate-binding/OmpA family protein [bacterium]